MEFRKKKDRKRKERTFTEEENRQKASNGTNLSLPHTQRYTHFHKIDVKTKIR